MGPDEIIMALEEGMRRRGWIANAYAQVEFLLGDLITNCRVFDHYAEQTLTVSHSAPKRVKKVRAMLQIDGPLSPFAPAVIEILDAFESSHENRNILAHGLCQFHFTPEGDAGFVFRKFDRSVGETEDKLIWKTFRPIDLQYHQAQSIDLSERTLELFRLIYAKLGFDEAGGVYDGVPDLT